MKPLIKVWCLPPDQTEAQLKKLFDKIVEACKKDRLLRINGEDELTILFPSDMMRYGAGTEIIIEITGVHMLAEMEEMHGTAKAVAEAVRSQYPKAKHIACEVLPIPRKYGVAILEK